MARRILIPPISACYQDVFKKVDIVQIDYKRTSIISTKPHVLKNILLVEDTMPVSFEHTFMVPFQLSQAESTNI
jgi:hypothetical protein